MRPTFLVIGAAKAGTTSFYSLLRQHPAIFMTVRKELHFFSFDRNWAKGADWYESWFADAGREQQRGESSTTYTVRRLFPHAAERAAAYDRGLKLIYLVRDPLRRIESGWQQLRRFGPAPAIRAAGLGDVPDAMWVDNSFNRAVRLQSDVLVESTNYWEELEMYRKYFDDEQLLVLLSEDLERDPEDVMRRSFAFLGVDPDVELSEYDTRANVFGQYPVHRPWLRRFWSSAWRRSLSAAVVDRLPQRLCERISRKLLRVPLTERPRWEPETRAWVLDLLGGDLERFLDHHRYPRDAWELR